MASRKPRGISVILPCLNEALTIEAAVLEAWAGIMRSGLPGEVIVVDNGSTDQSQMLAKRAHAHVITEPKKGYGSALHAGLKAARFSCSVYADCDLSYPLLDLNTLAKEIIENRADLVLGSRLNGKMEENAMPALNRYVGTPVLSFLIRIFFKLQTSDCNSGMRALRTELYTQLNLKSKGMEYASEMLVQTSRIKLRYAEVTIHYRKDQRGRPPHLRPLRDGLLHLKTLISHSFIFNRLLKGAVLWALVSPLIFRLCLMK